jgi:hypothetical protein
MRPTIDGILESSLYVSDVPRSVRFYEDVFGFRVISDFGERGCAMNAGPRQVLLLFKKGIARWKRCTTERANFCIRYPISRLAIRVRQNQIYSGKKNGRNWGSSLTSRRTVIARKPLNGMVSLLKGIFQGTPPFCGRWFTSLPNRSHREQTKGRLFLQARCRS